MATDGDAVSGILSMDWLKELTPLIFSVGKEVVFFLIAAYIVVESILHALSYFEKPFARTRIGKMLRRLSHERSPSELIKVVLIELGYREADHVLIKAANERQLFSTMGVSTSDAKKRLVALLKRSSRSLPEIITYGRDTPTESRYYIDTISAAHDQLTLDEMAFLMQYQLSLRSKGAHRIDFFLVPKTGNVLLGHALARRTGSLCVFRKEDKSPSRARSDVELDPSAAHINLEGLQLVLERSKDEGRPMYGVAIDCNCSGGSSLVRAVEEWNVASGVYAEELMPIDEVHILYRPDQSPLKVGCNGGVTLNYHRFADLTEAQKGRIISASKDKDLNAIVRDLTTVDK